MTTAQPPRVNPLDVTALRARLVAPNGRYAAVDVVASTGSTNKDLAAAARLGAAEKTVLVAEQQTAGQGRRSRGWASPAGSGIYLSVLLRPNAVPASRLPWVTLIAGVALARTMRSVGVEAGLKWPNDLLIGPKQRKAAGVLAEINTAGGIAVVLGIGVNVLSLPADTPLGPGGLAPTSLADEGATELDRTQLIIRLLTELGELMNNWQANEGDPAASGLLDEYRACCTTLGQRVRVELSGPAWLEGTATDLETDGALVVRADDGTEQVVSAGDVVHLRSAH